MLQYIHLVNLVNIFVYAVLCGSHVDATFSNSNTDTDKNVSVLPRGVAIAEVKGLNT